METKILRPRNHLSNLIRVGTSKSSSHECTMKIHRIFKDRIQNVEQLNRSLEKAKDSGATTVWCDLPLWLKIQTTLKSEKTSEFLWMVETPLASRFDLNDFAQPHKWVLLSQGNEPDLRNLKLMNAMILFRPNKVVSPHALLETIPE